MATATAFLSHRLLPISAQSRPKTRNSRNYPPKKLSQTQNPNPNPKTSISTVGSQATTYTRLPPKPDSFIIPPFDFASNEITLSDSIPSIKVPDRDLPIGLSNPQDDTVNGEFQSPSDSDSDYDDEGLGFEDGNPEDFFDGGDFLDEEEEGEEKEKGIPAVMRCFDRAKIYVKAGDGGNGVVAFRREKFVPLGGPSGGDGGRGGNVYVEVDGSMNSLLPFRKNIHFRAGRGNHGQGRKMAGARGEDVVVKVAPGTVIREAEEGALLLELLYPGQRALLLPGGRGGRGNASFKSGTNKVPKIAEKGEEGAEM